MRRLNFDLHELGLRLLSLGAHPDDAVLIRENAEEEFVFLAETEGRARALLWFWWHMLRTVALTYGFYNHRRRNMLSENLKLTWRQLKKQRMHFLINILGLAFGIASSLCVMLYVHYETAYDVFHEKADRLYRITADMTINSDFRLHQLGTAAILAHTIREHYPQFETVTQISHMRDVVVSNGDKVFKENRVFQAEASFFDLFSYYLTQGAAERALSDPGSIVLSESMARKYFGSADVLGRSLQVEAWGVRKTYQVTGIAADVPNQSHFIFDMLVSANSFAGYHELVWGHNNYATYVLARPGETRTTLEAQLDTLARHHFKDGQARLLWDWTLDPVKDIHLKSDLATGFEPNGSLIQVRFMTLIAAVILIIAMINYVNLSTAQAVKRAREVGVRKVLGAGRGQLFRQFMSESLLCSALAVFISIFMIELILPFLRALTGKAICMHCFSSFRHLPMLLVMTAMIGLASGVYPALVMTSFGPAQAFREQTATARGSFSGMIRNGLVIFQFAVSILLIAATLIIGRQLTFLKQKSLGFDKDQVLLIEQADMLGSNALILRDELEKLPEVVRASSSYHALGDRIHNWGVSINGKRDSELNMTMDFHRVDHAFLETMGLHLLSGRFFAPDMPTDSGAVVINEAAVRYFGIEDPVGGLVNLWRKDLRIIGVISDIHYETLRNEIKPMAIMLDNKPRFLLLKVRSGDLDGLVSRMEKAWHAFSPAPFQWQFLDDRLNKLYQNDRIMAKVTTFFSGTAIVISCMGLLGLARLITARRTREVGIRKTLGAGQSDVLRLLSMTFLGRVLTANVLAWPAAYWLMTNWLNGFAYRMDLTAQPFLTASGMALFIAVLAVGWHSIKASRTNPADSLRCE